MTKDQARAYFRDYFRARYAANKAANRCVYCSDPLPQGARNVSCVTCRRAKSARYFATKGEKQLANVA